MTKPDAVITLSRFTRDGAFVYGVTWGGTPLIAETSDELLASEYARAAYHNSASFRELHFWDGDSQVETILDVKGKP